ncbi:MAG: VWA domain-containing protein [Candidatus Eisenbacteria bacterium]
MAEPEELIVEAAHAAAVHSNALWRRMRPPAPGPPGLSELKPRLELFLAALCAGAPPIVVAEPPAVPTWLGRWARRLPPHLVERRALPSTDGARLRLPPRMDEDAGQEAVAFRIVALGQALRARRGSARALPDDASTAVRDLYTLAEAVAVDREMASLAPGLAPHLERLKQRMLAQRPADRLLLATEREVERLVRAVLAAPPGEPPTHVPLAPTPAASLAWAEASAAVLVEGGARYRGLPAVPLWGRIDPIGLTVAPTPGAGGPDDPADPPRPGRTHMLRRRPRVREAAPDEDDAHTGMWMAPTSDRQESVEDPMGLTRPTDRDDAADAGALADALAELPEARLVATPGRAREILASEDPPAVRALRAPDSTSSATGIAYPEWNWKSASYVENRAHVRLVPPREGTDAWVAAVSRRHAPLVQQARRRFERLRPRRVRLTRQMDGPEVDLDAWVEAQAGIRAGSAASDRLYVVERPLRRDVAVLVLVDASASTDAWVDGDRRVIDVEKEALVLVCEALTALGDRYAILAFSGEGPESVHVSTLKDFGAPADAGVRRRIAGLEPDRYTRLGAAVRHATAMLARERARHRLLLLLSDGKPNDVDQYEGRYGVEDARQAVHEARLEGILPFCLTVDRQATVYLPRIFQPSGFTVLRRTSALPGALLDVVRQLVT